MPRPSALNLTRWLHLAVLVVGLVYAAFAHADVRLGQMRLSAGDESTRAELQLDAAPGEYRIFSLANPDRLVLDLPGASLADGFRAPAPNGRVIGVRTGSPEAGKLRIVFDLAGPVKPRTRVEGAGRESRLVLEMFRDEAAVAANVAEAKAPQASASTAAPE